MERRFKALPLGTRFRYWGQEAIWVILERHGCGLVAEWNGADGPLAGQSICSAAETEAQCEVLTVLDAE